MMRRMLLSKIHRLTVTHADVNYEGSISISEELLKAANILPGEAVWVWNVTNGQRFETYTIETPGSSAIVSVNGAAARLVTPGDIIIVAAFGLMSDAEAREYEPRAIFMDTGNRIKEIRGEQIADLPYDSYVATPGA
jgi:aspartate 1-decarboxylase